MEKCSEKLDRKRSIGGIIFPAICAMAIAGFLLNPYKILKFVPYTLLRKRGGTGNGKIYFRDEGVNQGI